MLKNWLEQPNIKDMQETCISSMHVNLFELLMPSPCSKSVQASTWVAKGPFKDLNLNVISAKEENKTKPTKLEDVYMFQ